MSKGRHRGANRWGFLPPIGRSLFFVPHDIAIMSLRCYMTGWIALITCMAYAIGGGGADAFSISALCVSVAFGVVGRGLFRYSKTTLPHIKARHADDWIHAVHQHRIEMMNNREEALTRSIAELSERFEQEKTALLEIREERMAEERALGFLEGLKKYPELKAHHANPRNRLRVVKSTDEESA